MVRSRAFDATARRPDALLDGSRRPFPDQRQVSRRRDPAGDEKPGEQHGGGDNEERDRVDAPPAKCDRDHHGPDRVGDRERRRQDHDRQREDDDAAANEEPREGEEPPGWPPDGDEERGENRPAPAHGAALGAADGAGDVAPTSSSS